MSHAISRSCELETARLHIAPWHEAARQGNFDLAQVIAAMLTARTTAALPERWNGDFSAERTAAWIDERDQESHTLLVIGAGSGRPVGLVILADVPIDAQSVDVRIGYLFAGAFVSRPTHPGVATTG